MTFVLDPEGRRYELVPIDCPTCGPGARRRLGIRGGRYHRYRLGIESPIEQCRSCGLLYPNPFPRPLDAQEMYGDPENYFACHGDFEPECERRRDVIRDIRSRTGMADPSILDVGSGRGDLLEAARREGITRCVGLELSTAMIEYARTRGLTVLDETAEEFARRDVARFDAVVLAAVLEHVGDPSSLVEACVGLLRPGGTLLIDVPREPNIVTWFGSVLSRIRRSPGVLNLSPTFSPYHVWGFSPRSLSALLRKHSVTIDETIVLANPAVPSTAAALDRLKATGGGLLIRLGNRTGTSTNMTVWATRR
ncbi:MAG: methyltransferase domain-containing protein [Acidimicrobiia bacterium]|nr:methyltransferase domain-containing protein [Acidimicrobiia bacterium]